MIKVDNISFAYSPMDGDPTTILSHVDVDIHQGESIAVMGHNGSGKTTFARCLNGLLVPTSGQILVDGFHVADEENILDIRRRVGMVFQNPDNQIVSTTVEREIAFGLENLGYSYEDMHEIVDAALDKFGLLKYRLQSPHYLSGGEKQRLALAAVMAMQPRYLILDEPTSLLDPRSRREILALVQELHTGGARDITTMLITQFPDEALMADRLLVFDHGRIIMDAPPKAIFADEQALHEIGLEPPLVFKVDKLLAQLDAC